MNFMRLSINFSFLSREFTLKNPAVIKVSETANNMVASQYYGESIETILIGLIAVEPSYDAFAKPRRPRFTEHLATKAFGSIPVVINKTLEIDIKLDYEQVRAAKDEELQKIVATIVLNTIHDLKLPKKVTDFNKNKFGNSTK